VQCHLFPDALGRSRPSPLTSSYGAIRLPCACGFAFATPPVLP